MPQLAAGRIPNRQLGIPDSRVGRVQLPQDRFGATANKSVAMIRMAMPSLARLMSWFSNVFGAGFCIANHRLAEVVVLSSNLDGRRLFRLVTSNAELNDLSFLRA